MLRGEGIQESIMSDFALYVQILFSVAQEGAPSAYAWLFSSGALSIQKALFH